MKKVLRFMGIEGRTTIPLAIRRKIGLKAGDIVSFALENGEVILRKEKLCDQCRGKVCEYYAN